MKMNFISHEATLIFLALNEEPHMNFMKLAELSSCSYKTVQTWVTDFTIDGFIKYIKTGRDVYLELTQKGYVAMRALKLLLRVTGFRLVKTKSFNSLNREVFCLDLKLNSAFISADQQMNKTEELIW